MKKVLNGLLMIVIALACTMGNGVTVDARPLDDGYRDFQMGYTEDPMWVDANGIYWDIHMKDAVNPLGTDESTIYAYNSNNGVTIAGIVHFYSTITSSINFRKGIATFKSAEIDLTVTFDTTADTYWTTGSRKEGDYRYSYLGPAYIKGTILINSITYSFEGEVNGNRFAYLIDQHTIVK